jgi:hypothetical protein
MEILENDRISFSNRYGKAKFKDKSGNEIYNSKKVKMETQQSRQDKWNYLLIQI